jgi:hypothetical protein
MGKEGNSWAGVGQGHTAPLQLNLHSDHVCDIVRFRKRPSASHRIGVQLICALTLLVHTADPRMSTISTCPTTIEIVPYNIPFLVPRALSSDANVLTVVRHPQYPSSNPCNIEHAPGDTGCRNPCKAWNTASNDVPNSLATSVPMGSSFKRGFKRMERT